MPAFSFTWMDTASVPDTIYKLSKTESTASMTMAGLSLDLSSLKCLFFILILLMILGIFTGR